MKKRVWSILLVLCMMLALLPFGALAAGAGDGEVIDSGHCGDDADYVLTEDGTLTITGFGPTDEFYDIRTDTAINLAPWLDHMKEITAVVIEDGITSLGSWAFYGAESLKTVRLPGTLEQIGFDAFYRSAITQVKLPASMKTIGGFSSCKKLSKVVLSEGAAKIDAGAFSGCSALREIALPSTIKELGYHCFGGSGIRSIEIPQGVKEIQSECFRDCTHLERVSLPDGLESLWDYSFKGCSALREIVLPATIKSFGINDFSGCTSLTSVVVPDGIKALDGTFTGCTSLTDVSIPDSVTSLSYTFYRCTSLKKLDIPESVTRMTGTFGYCSALESAALPSGLKELGENTFCDCTALKALVIPNGVLEIGEHCFEHCKNLEWIRIPDTVSSIGQSAFSRCTALTEIRIPTKVRAIENSAFQGCTRLERAFLPSSVTKIGYEAFDNCPKLKELYYHGTETQLQKISVASGNDSLGRVQVYLLSAYPDAYFGFLDMPADTNWAYDGIAFCVLNGYMNGMGGGYFQPNGVTTRAQLVTILWRMSGEPKPTKAAPFTDCDIRWAKDAIAWAAESGIVNGVGNNLFNPNGPITREQLVTFFYRFCREYLEMDVSQAQSLNKFPDAAKVSAWAKDAMRWGVAVGLISGVGTKTGAELQPKGSATRAQIARVILNFCTTVVPAQ